MTANKVKRWLVALLGADADVVLHLESGSSSVLSASQDIPSDEGVYIGIDSSAPADVRGFETVSVKITVVLEGEVECYKLIDDVRDALWLPAGTSAAWGVNPSTVALSVKSVSPVELPVPPEAIGEDNSYRAVLALAVIGRDEARPG